MDEPPAHAYQGGPVDQICLVIPIKSGKTAAARAFMRELEMDRKPDYDRSERRIGIDKEVWYVAHGAGGDEFVAYIEAASFPDALGAFSRSRDEFDMWFKQQLDDATGLDLNDPPEMTLPELVSSYVH
jgi:hypothetical protein